MSLPNAGLFRVRVTGGDARPAPVRKSGAATTGRRARSATRISATTVRRSLATVAILACLAATTGAALVAARYILWHWRSGLLGAVVVVLAVVGIGLMLDALEKWIEGAEAGAGEKQR